MMKWFKKNHARNSPDIEHKDGALLSEAPLVDDVLDDDKQDKRMPLGVFSRFKKGLTKTRQQLGDSVTRLFLGRKEIDANLLEELENILLSADLGIETTQKVLDSISGRLARKQLTDGEAVMASLKKELHSLLTFDAPSLTLRPDSDFPFVILMTGVNGAGKTTTIGKLACKYQREGKSVMLAAGDTFRAAAVEQLKVWGERNHIPVIAQHSGADSASVIFDAVQAARARHVDVLIADTAGRLHTQGNLMDELKKIKRVIQKINPAAPHEIMLVLDASIGQNALNQARHFNKDIHITGITMTKLDGSAKGGILFAIANELQIPFRYLGVGEGIEDLRPFDAAQFISAIFNDDQMQADQ